MSCCILVILVIIITVLFIIPLAAYNMGFGHRYNGKDDGMTPLISDFPDIQRKKVKFKSNKNELTGYLYNYDSHKNHKGIIVVVNGHSTVQNYYLSEINFFIKKGYVILSYDGTGCGESEGIIMKGYPQWVCDLNNALSFIESQNEFKELPIYLFGHSLGGYGVTAVLYFNHPRIKAVVACSGVNSGKEYVRKFAEDHPCLFTRYMVLFFKYYERLLFGKMADNTAFGGINKSNAKVMVIHSKDDTYVPMDCSIFAYKNKIINKNVEFLLLEGKSHYVFKSKEAVEYLTSKGPKNDRSKVLLIDNYIMNKITDFYESA